jgi:hypothetical protein
MQDISVHSEAKPNGEPWVNLSTEGSIQHVHQGIKLHELPLYGLYPREASNIPDYFKRNISVRTGQNLEVPSQDLAPWRFEKRFQPFVEGLNKGTFPDEHIGEYTNTELDQRNVVFDDGVRKLSMPSHVERVDPTLEALNKIIELLSGGKGVDEPKVEQPQVDEPQVEPEPVDEPFDDGGDDGDLEVKEIDGTDSLRDGGTDEEVETTTIPEIEKMGETDEGMFESKIADLALDQILPPEEFDGLNKDEAINILKILLRKQSTVDKRIKWVNVFILGRIIAGTYRGGNIPDYQKTIENLPNGKLNKKHILKLAEED